MINNNTENKNTTTVYLTPTTRFVAGMTFDNMLIIDVTPDRERVWVLEAYENPYEEEDPLFKPAYPIPQNWFNRHEFFIQPFHLRPYVISDSTVECFDYLGKRYLSSEWDLPKNTEEGMGDYFDIPEYLRKLDCEERYDDVTIIGRVLGWKPIIRAIKAAGYGIKIHDDNSLHYVI